MSVSKMAAAAKRRFNQPRDGRRDGGRGEMALGNPARKEALAKNRRPGR